MKILNQFRNFFRLVELVVNSVHHRSGRIHFTESFRPQPNTFALHRGAVGFSSENYVYFESLMLRKHFKFALWISGRPYVYLRASRPRETALKLISKTILPPQNVTHFFVSICTVCRATEFVQNSNIWVNYVVFAGVF